MAEPEHGQAVGFAERRYAALRWSLSMVMYVFMVASAIVMAVILAIAVYTIFTAVVDYLGAPIPHAVETTAEAVDAPLPAKTLLLVDIVKSVELMFLAPLAFLLVMGIGMYSDEILTGRHVGLAKKQLQTVKSFTAALFISVTTAHVVVTLISEEKQDPLYFLPAVALILILAVYIAILERYSG